MNIDLKDHFIKAVESYPDFSEAHLQLALIYQEEGDDNNAVKHFKSAIISDLEETERLENKGDELMKNYQFQNAKDQFIKSQEKKVHCSEVYYQQSIYFNEREKIKLSQSSLENCINIIPLHSKAHRDLGVILLNKKKLDPARLHFEKALDIDYSDSISHFYLGKVMASMKDIDDAELHYLSALDINPKYSECMLELALIKLGNQLEEDARKYYRDARKINPSIKHPDIEKIID